MHSRGSSYMPGLVATSAAGAVVATRTEVWRPVGRPEVQEPLWQYGGSGRAGCRPRA